MPSLDSNFNMPSSDLDSTMPFAPAGPEVSIKQGRYRGTNVVNDSTRAQPIQWWLNVPYALPPTGDRRFRPPVPLLHKTEDANHVFDASKWGNRCPQSMDAGVVGASDENCLNLNIFRPKAYFDSDSQDGKEGTKKLLPVLIYIHGGHFNGGSGRDGQISHLVTRAYTPIIGVTFNYRVGAFGFLAGKIAMAEGQGGGVNAGLKDQYCAIQWVVDNIEAFGGDPRNITVLGTSAGAHSIGHHLNNHAFQPLFQKAIIESGASTARACYPADHDFHESQFTDFISTIGCSHVPSNRLIAHLRTLPTETIRSASAASALRWLWQPVIGNFPIFGNPIQYLRSGNWWSHVSIMTGFNSNEGSVFILPKPIYTAEQFTQFWQLLRPDFTELDFMTLEEVYPDPATHVDSPYNVPRPDVTPQTSRLEAAYSDYAYISPVQHTAYFASHAGQATYLYEFALQKSPSRGADHGDHVDFVTGKSVVSIANWKYLSDRMGRFWVGFIATGDPNAGITDGWKWESVDRYQNESTVKLRRMVFGEGNTEGWRHRRYGVPGNGVVGSLLRMVNDGDGDAYREKRRQFWWSIVGRYKAVWKAA